MACRCAFFVDFKKYKGVLIAENLPRGMWKKSNKLVVNYLKLEKMRHFNASLVRLASSQNLTLATTGKVMHT